MAEAKNFINGKWVDGNLGRLLMENPSYETQIGEIAHSDAKDVDTAVTAARDAFEGEWGRTPAVERGRMLYRAYELVKKHEDELSKLESDDCGKPLKQARVDAQLFGRYLEFYAGAVDKFHGETIPYLEGYSVMTMREPLGVSGNIIPWNYPLQMSGRTIGAAVAAGNSVVFKPAEDACLSVVRLTELLEEAGFPPGSINLITGTGIDAGAPLAAHPDIDHLSFTGSPETGQAVMEASAKHHRPVLLELGGKSPQVIFEDANLEAAIPFIINASIQNAGQTCSAGSRVLIQQSIFDKLTEMLVARYADVTVGPADEDPTVGPLVSAKQKKSFNANIEKTLAEGVKILAQAKIPEGKGHFVAPTLLGNVEPRCYIAQTEVFGPVLAAIPFKDEADAIKIANDTAYGLVSAVWTRDGSRAMRVARRIKAGQVFINGYGAGGGVELPFGGRKHSGFGREKGMEAIKHLTAVKTIVINHG